MEIFVYFVPAALGIVLWIGVSELREKALEKKQDEVSRIKKASRRWHSYEDHNTQFRCANESTISFWKKEVIDSKTEERMRHSIRKKIRGTRNE